MTDSTNSPTEIIESIKAAVDDNSTINTDVPTTDNSSVEDSVTTPIEITSTEVIVPMPLTIKEKVSGLSEDTINGLLKKFAPIIDVLSVKENPKEISYVADVCINHIALNHNDITSDVSSWGVVVVRRLYNTKVIEYENQIGIELDAFFKYTHDHILSFMADDIAWSVSQYDAEVVFVDMYLSKRILNK
jgi:hypothetical protein